MATNPPITVGELANVPAPGSGVSSAWAQQATNRIVHRFATVAARNTAWPAATAGNGAFSVTLDTGTLWQVVAGAWVPMAGPLTAWTRPTFQNSWTDFGSGLPNVQYRKNGDEVEFRGVAKSGTVAVAMFTLPAGFRPPINVFYYPILHNNGTAIGRLDIGADGTVVPGASVTNASLSLEGVRFSVTA